MSFKKYFEHKKELKTEVCLSNYTDKLKEELFSVATKPNSTKIEKIKNNLIDEFELSKLLDEVKYPYAENLKIILKTNNSKKIADERKKISNWSESQIVKKIVSLLLFYESIFYSNSILVEDIEKITESYLNQTLIKMHDLASKIDFSKEKIKWHNHSIKIEALYPNEGFLPNEVLLKIGDKFNKKFVINLNTNQIKEIEDENDLPKSLKEDSNTLIENLFKESNKNKIAILYMNKPKEERENIERIKKEISLGMKQFLPFNSVLFENVKFDENLDVWKVRTDLNKLKKFNDQYIVLTEDAPIKWIKKYENTKS
jgi:hypothetical protein